MAPSVLSSETDPLRRGKGELEPAWTRPLTSPWAAALLLFVFWVLMIGSLREKSITADEIAHATAGYTYWKFNDYRINPENGNLPQRVAGLPLVLSNYHFPSTDSKNWFSSDEWRLGYDWFYHSGNNVGSMLFRGRAVCGLMAVILGAVVWFWSRRLFGPWGGLISVLLFVLNPTILANGALITSDSACSLFFLAATLCFWAMLHRLTLRRVLVSGLVVGGLFVSKMSAVLFLPVAFTLVLARLIGGEPLPISIGLRGVLTLRSQQALVFAGAAIAHFLIVVFVIWSAYGFRYSAFAKSDPARDHLAFSWEYLLYKIPPNQVLAALHFTPEQNERVKQMLADSQVFTNQWTHEALQAMRAVRATVLTSEQVKTYDDLTTAPPPARAARFIEALNRKHWLPESYVYGYAYAWSFSRSRAAFMDGDFNLYGWKTFFPYTFLVKTPVPVFGMMGLAFVALVFRRKESLSLNNTGSVRRPRLLYETIPLWTLFAFYWAAVIPGHLNIGHRHIMVTYAPLFVLCGASAYWLEGARRLSSSAGARLTPRLMRAGAVLVGSLLFWLGAEVLHRFPNYLAFFNTFAGGPAQGYRHLVDSSLDWGQDLLGVKHYLERSSASGPTYLSYFGNGSPDYYTIAARSLHSSPGWDQLDVPALKTLDLPANDVSGSLREELSKHPDYDPDMVGLSRAGDRVNAALVKKAAALRLTEGTYLISATLIQPVLASIDGPFGPWNSRYEATYQELAKAIKPLLEDSLAVRRAALGQRDPQMWQSLWANYDDYRFARLTAFLRQREPDGFVGYSILVYHLSDADISRALNGPPPELSRDVPKLLEQRYGPPPK